MAPRPPTTAGPSGPPAPRPEAPADRRSAGDGRLVRVTLSSLRRVRRTFLTLVLVGALLGSAVGLAAPVPAGALPSDAVSSAVNAYDIARDRLATSESAIADAEARRERRPAGVGGCRRRARPGRRRRGRAARPLRRARAPSTSCTRVPATRTSTTRCGWRSPAGDRASTGPRRSCSAPSAGSRSRRRRCAAREQDLERSREALDGALVAAVGGRRSAPTRPSPTPARPTSPRSRSSPTAGPRRP